MGKDKQTVTVVMDKTQVKRLDAIAKRADRSRAWVVRQMVGRLVEADARREQAAG